MPHLQVQYSANLDKSNNIKGFCVRLAEEIAALGGYPPGGIRVRALAAEHYALADQHPENAFVDMIFRIGAGRSAEHKQRTGEHIMRIGRDFFSAELASGHFMLSLEIVEINAGLSWKVNSIHQRLQGGITSGS